MSLPTIPKIYHESFDIFRSVNRPFTVKYYVNPTKKILVVVCR